MCGILSIINKQVTANAADLISASSIISHRGPDDEGFLTWAPGDKPAIWAGKDTAESTHAHWHYNTLAPNTPYKVGFGHRRLSILDLSPAGHQPMIYEKASLAICFNGEIYNYLEIKAELSQKGHQFVSTSDTEVILHAWEEWGVNCISRFNGMFAIVMLDYKNNELFAVRDRFGVKPLFYYNSGTALYLASEIKQIRTCPQYSFQINKAIVRKYLATGAVNQTEQTFDTQIKQLPCGHYIHMKLDNAENTFKTVQWYKLEPRKWLGTYDEAVTELRRILKDTVKLRLRSDVKVGSCLSGGLDSSSIVCLAADILKEQGDFAGQETVTACYDAKRYDEWKFAEEVIKKSNAHPHQTFPSFDQLKSEVEQFLWHQDEPTGSTSQFSQWAVFKATHEAGLKVMIDGQGADEQLAGYGGNDMSFFSGLLREGKYGDYFDEIKFYKKEHGHWPIGFILGSMQLAYGSWVSALLPAKLRLKPAPNVAWLKEAESSGMYADTAKSLRDNLLRQLYGEPLPALLRYEDHNSMAWSVESRTPFMDYRLVEFTMGLPARFLYKRGVRKAILRSAMEGIIPDAITNRRDKMGFVTPEELWLKGEGKEWFLKHIEATCAMLPEMIDKDKLLLEVNKMIDGKTEFNFMPWRVVALGIWYKRVSQVNAH